MLKRAFFTCLLTIAISALLFIFWQLVGHQLSYDVYSDNGEEMTFWYKEEFSLSGKLILTSLLALIFGLVTASFLSLNRWLAKRLRPASHLAFTLMKGY
jgi:hypothetical protein